MGDLRRYSRGNITGVTTPTSSVDMLLSHKDSIIRAARTINRRIIGLKANMIWKRVKVHGVPVARYVGKKIFGTEKLQEELVAENKGVRIPAAVRWLGRAGGVKARYKEGTIVASSVTFAVVGEPPPQKWTAAPGPPLRSRVL